VVVIPLIAVALSANAASTMIVSDELYRALAKSFFYWDRSEVSEH
jgi:hypothetical protein